MDVFYSLCHSILCRRGELASIYAPQLVQILLGGVGLLDVLADNDTFCSFSHSKYVQMIVSFANCPAEAVRAEGCRMIQHYVGLGRELKGRASEKDLRVRMFNFSVDTAFPASPLDSPLNASFTSSSSSSATRSSSNTGSEQASLLTANNSFLSNEDTSPSRNLRDTLPTIARDTLPTTVRDTLPTTVRDTLPTIARDTLPTTPCDASRTTLVSSEVGTATQHKPCRDTEEDLSDGAESSDSLVEVTPYHNSDASVLEVARRSTWQPNSDLRRADSLMEESDDELLAPTRESEALVLGEEDAIAARLRRMERVFYVMMHMYQTSSYLIVLQQRYTALYRQFLEELDALRACLVGADAGDALSGASAMVDEFLNFEPYILSSFFKLLLLCCRNYYAIPDRTDAFQVVFPRLQQAILDLKAEYQRVRGKTCQGEVKAEQEAMLVQIAEEAMTLQERLQSAAVEEVCLRHEAPELLNFIRALVEMVSVLSNSGCAHDLAGRVDLYTLFYIASTFFLALEHSQTRLNIVDPIYAFLWKCGRRHALPVECSPVWTPWWPTSASSISSACTASSTARSPGTTRTSPLWPTSSPPSTRTT